MIDLAKSYEYFNPTNITAPIHIIGCGSVGATVAEMLVRLGLQNITLWDMDVVNSHNLANQIFRNKDIGLPKVVALKNILCDINPELEDFLVLEENGWDGDRLSGYIFLCVDSIELRHRIVSENMMNPYVLAMFDFRTGLEEAQHYAADWSDFDSRSRFISTMDFSDAEANEASPVSACGITLGVASTVRMVSAVGVSNFVNLIKGKEMKYMIVIDAFTPGILAM